MMSWHSLQCEPKPEVHRKKKKIIDAYLGIGALPMPAENLAHLPAYVVPCRTVLCAYLYTGVDSQAYQILGSLAAADIPSARRRTRCRRKISVHRR